VRVVVGDGVGVVTGWLGTLLVGLVACRLLHAFYGTLKEILEHYNKQLNIKYFVRIMQLLSRQFARAKTPWLL